MYPMNEEPPRSPAQTGQRGPVIQKETSYVITERIQVINSDADVQPQQADLSITDRIKQSLPIEQARNSIDNIREHMHLPTLPIDQARHSIDNLREHIHLPQASLDSLREHAHLPQFSKEIRRWLPVISSVILAIILHSLKSHLSPNDSALSHNRFGNMSHSHKLGDFGWDREAIHDKVRETLRGVKASVKEHYQQYPDQNWLTSEPVPQLTAEERAARLIEDLHEQARRLHIQDPTEVHYEPLTEKEQERLHRSAHSSHRVSHRDTSSKVPLKHDNSEALVVSESDVAAEIHNATEYHRAQRVVHLGHDLRTRAESVPHRLMRGVQSIREQFVSGMEQVHDLIMKERTAPDAEEEIDVDSKKSSSAYHERAEHLIHELEELSRRIADSEHWRAPIVKKSPWYMRPVDWVTESRPLEWAQDQYDWVVAKTFGVSEAARHHAVEAEEEVRHAAAQLQELMTHELRLLKLEVNRMPRRMRKASHNLKTMPLDALEHFA